MTDFAALITQLRVLAYLTRTEAQVARLRVPQATGDDVRDELRRNAADADARAARIAGVLHDLGALPDPVAPTLGRVAALVRGSLEQTQPLDEALLGDLALEHQLRDRARYVATLADAVDLSDVRVLADDLVAAHSETVEWLRGVLDDVAAGRRAALDASPLQRVAAQVARAANAPGRPALDRVGAAVTGTVTRTVDGVVGTVAQVGGEVRTGVTQAADEGGRSESDDAAADGSEDAGAGADRADPLPDLGELSARAAIAALRTLDDPADLAAVLASEQAHDNRPGVVAAARIRADAVRER